MNPPITINPHTPGAITLTTPLAEDQIAEHFQHLAWTPPTPPIQHEAQDPEDFDHELMHEQFDAHEAQDPEDYDFEAMQEEFTAEMQDFPDDDEPTGVPLDYNPQYQDWMPEGSEVCPQCKYPTLNGELCIFCREEAEIEAEVVAAKDLYNQRLAEVKAAKAGLRAALKRKYESRAVDIDLTIKEE